MSDPLFESDEFLTSEIPNKPKIDEFATMCAIASKYNPVTFENSVCRLAYHELNEIRRGACQNSLNICSETLLCMGHCAFPGHLHCTTCNCDATHNPCSKSTKCVNHCEIQGHSHCVANCCDSETDICEESSMCTFHCKTPGHLHCIFDECDLEIKQECQGSNYCPTHCGEFKTNSYNSLKSKIANINSDAYHGHCFETSCDDPYNLCEKSVSCVEHCEKLDHNHCSYDQCDADDYLCVLESRCHEHCESKTHRHCNFFDVYSCKLCKKYYASLYLDKSTRIENYVCPDKEKHDSYNAVDGCDEITNICKYSHKCINHCKRKTHSVCEVSLTYKKLFNFDEFID